jgi:energy-converting hydrogenase Eha subunit H
MMMMMMMTIVMVIVMMIAKTDQNDVDDATHKWIPGARKKAHQVEGQKKRKTKLICSLTTFA